jgi:hypothetical protein
MRLRKVTSNPPINQTLFGRPVPSKVRSQE